MREIEVILIIFVLLYIIENKPINILMNFIGITISIAIILALNEYIRIIEGEYISYMLILVQVSALTILFGFIIMLYASHLISDIPKSSFKVPLSATTPNQLNKHSWFVGKGYNYSSNIKYIMVLLGLSILLSIYLFIPYNLITNKFFNWIIYFLEPTITLPYNLIDYNILISSPKHTWLIEDIGNYLYTDIGGIIKLLLVTVILLLAIIGLFFML